MKEDKNILLSTNMAKMKSDAPLDYAVFQLSPKRSRLDMHMDCFLS